MADIIDLEEKKDETLTQEQVQEISKTLEELLSEDNEENAILKQFMTFLSMDEENFKLLAPGVLQSFQQTLNNPNDKISLVQSLNASGAKAEDLLQIFLPMVDEIDEIEGLSDQKKDFLKEVMGSVVNAVQETEGIAKRIIQIPIELCHPDAKIPQYANIDDSGLDIYALDDYTIAPGETKLIPTGFKVALPPGYELQVRPKSGRALKTKLRIANTPGTIDAGYRDEVGVIVENVDPPIRAIHLREQILELHENGAKTTQPLPLTEGDIEYGQSYTIGKGEKFAQLVLSEVPKAAFFRVDSVEEIGDNRGGGFGSTGV
jgi:dUTPase